MHKPDRVGALIVTITVFGLYWAVANFLFLFGVTSLPLGAVDFVPFMIFDVAVVNLFVLRQRKRARTSSSSQR